MYEIVIFWVSSVFLRAPCTASVSSELAMVAIIIIFFRINTINFLINETNRLYYDDE